MKELNSDVACRGERMRAVEVDGLACEHMDGTRVLGGQRVVRQVQMEVESGNAVQQTELVQVLVDRQWSDLLGRLARQQAGARIDLAPGLRAPSSTNGCTGRSAAGAVQGGRRGARIPSGAASCRR